MRTILTLLLLLSTSSAYAASTEPTREDAPTPAPFVTLTEVTPAPPALVTPDDELPSRLDSDLDDATPFVADQDVEQEGSDR